MRKSVLVLTLIAAALAAGCRRQVARAYAASEPAPVLVPVVTVGAAAFQATLPVTGTLVSNSRVDVKAETTGRITRFDKQEGDRVTAGEPVAWVDDENCRLGLRQAETAVNVAEAARERAGLLEAHSRSELERAANLLQSGGITEKDLKAAQLADRDARAQVAVANAQLDQARVALDVARKRLAETVIKAPIAGEIQKKFVNKGAYVEPPTPVLTIVDNSRLELESPVPAADLGTVRPGQRVAFGVNSYPGEVFEGKVVDIAPAVDEQTRAAKLRIQVANAGGKLKAGMFAQGEILTAAKDAAIVIPAAAVYRDDRSAASASVFVVENGKAARRAVVIGTERDSQLEIAQGLKPGDRLIAEQSIEIADGVRVRAK